MSIAGRLWRVLKGRGGSVSDIDPSELLRELYQNRRSPPVRGRASPPPSSPPPASSSAPPTELQRAYARLELPYGAPLKEAKQAWRRLMKKYHPDMFQDDPRRAAVAERVAAAITEAYKTIEDSGA